MHLQVLEVWRKIFTSRNKFIVTVSAETMEFHLKTVQKDKEMLHENSLMIMVSVLYIVKKLLCVRIKIENKRIVMHDWPQVETYMLHILNVIGCEQLNV